jgi:hypothetical protein
LDEENQLIERKFPTLLTAYRGLTDELAYNKELPILKWGVCIGYKDLITVRVEDALDNDNMNLGMASYTKSRWTRFLRRYLRSDFSSWIDEAMAKLQRYPSRPFVASYSVNLNTGHNYGGCLASLQIRICPVPEVILTSRACHVDKVGFLDLSLINVVAKKMGVPKVKGTWVISNCFISGISQVYYLKRFEMPLQGHRLEKTLKRLIDVDYDDIKFGPLKRGRKRMMALDEHGFIPNSIDVDKLSIAPGKFFGELPAITTMDVDPEGIEDFLEEMGCD